MDTIEERAEEMSRKVSFSIDDTIRGLVRAAYARGAKDQYAIDRFAERAEMFAKACRAYCRSCGIVKENCTCEKLKAFCDELVE